MINLPENIPTATHQFYLKVCHAFFYKMDVFQFRNKIILYEVWQFLNEPGQAPDRNSSANGWMRFSYGSIVFQHPPLYLILRAGADD